MPVAPSVPIDVARGTQFNARKLSDGLLKEDSATIVCIYVKQSSPVEYWNGTAWVTSDPGNQAMAQDATVKGVYEDAVTYDDAGVDYIIVCWDSGDTDVQKLAARVRGVQPEEYDGAWRVHITVKDTDQNGDPIPDVTVSIKNASANEISRATTGSNGQATSLAVVGAASYTVTLVKAEWSFTDQTLVVAADDTSPKTAEYYGTGFDPGVPAGGYCIVFGWLKEVEGGVAIQEQRIRVGLIGRPVADSDGVFYDAENSHDVPDADGYWALTLRQGMTVRLFSTRLNEYQPTNAIDKVILVPSVASKKLSEIAEAAID